VASSSNPRRRTLSSESPPARRNPLASSSRANESSENVIEGRFPSDSRSLEDLALRMQEMNQRMHEMNQRMRSMHREFTEFVSFYKNSKKTGTDFYKENKSSFITAVKKFLAHTFPLYLCNASKLNDATLESLFSWVLNKCPLTCTDSQRKSIRTQVYQYFRKTVRACAPL